jgi:N-acyl-D-amino-acid deacylase
VITGNCGVGFAPVRPGQEDELIDMMEGVEDIPGTALYEGIPWGSWESFPEYIGYLDGHSWAIDVGLQIPHGALRYYVMGPRSWDDDPGNSAPTADELAQMVGLVRDARAAGALGCSTSRILFHRSMSGYSVPGTFAPEEELRALASGLREAGPTVVQAIPGGVNRKPSRAEDPYDLGDEVRMFGRISRDCGVRITFTTAQSNEDPDAWKMALEAARAQNAAGAHLSPMIAPRGATILTTLQGYHYFMQRPSFRRYADLPHAEMVAALRQPEVKRAILEEADVRDPKPGSMRNSLPAMFSHSLGKTFPLRMPLNYEPGREESLEALAARARRDPFEFLYDYLLEDDGTAVGMLIAANYAHGNLDVCREMLLEPDTVSGLSDAGAHVNFICDMGVATFHLTHWVRDRTYGETLPVELVVAKITSAPARTFGLTDRGVLAEGKRADINVIDLDNLASERPVLVRDLPAGGTRFLQQATGYITTIKNGVQTRIADKDTGVRLGRIVRPRP